MRGQLREIQSLLLYELKVTSACDPFYFFTHLVIYTSIIHLSMVDD